MCIFPKALQNLGANRVNYEELQNRASETLSYATGRAKATLQNTEVAGFYLYYY